ncbi:unnamed protein product, partial [Mesorhabditis belari]|uniref:Pre-mRNA-splicing factor 38 n=1 Tax=Mesorhabditis belari TaxID=2138241 RepID=A0AAF3J5D7_9BILA
MDDPTIYDDELVDEETTDVYRVTKRNNILAIHGNKETMNLNTLVLENVIQSQYNRNVLVEYVNYQQVCDEAFYNVRHLEPWERGTRKTQGMTGMCGGVRGVGAGGVVSSAFCCLYKFHTLKMTRRQLIALIDNRQSSYLRGLGFLYVRFTQAPADLWSWFEPYFEDEEEIDPRSGGGDKMTFGNMVRLMLTKLDWYSTLFPRIPVPIQKQIDENFAKKRQSTLNDMERQRERERERDRARDDRDQLKRPRDDEKKKEEVPVKKVKTRCHHHLRHHHCRKHRKECPKKAKEERAKKDEAIKEAAQQREEEQKNGTLADVHMGVA